MIFVDSNIPMYLIGAAHPNKERARVLLKDSIRRQERLVTDTEVFQEILHRYSAIRRPEAIQPAFELLLEIADEIFAFDMQDIEAAKEKLLKMEDVSARDALHLAVMKRQGIDRVLSFDAGFDSAPGVSRLF